MRLVRRSIHVWRLSAATALVAFVAVIARAQDPTPEVQEKARIVYQAPADCPDRDAFIAQVRERINTDWEPAPGELARTIDVTVSASGAGYVARIGFLDARGRRAERKVSGPTCAEVVEGIALVTALAIRAQVAEPESESAAPAESAAPEASASASPEPNAVPPKPATAPKPTHRRPSVPKATANPLALHVRGGGRGVVEVNAGPGISTGSGAFVALESRIGVAEIAYDAFSTTPMTVQVPARLSLYAARVNYCWPFELTSSVSFEVGAFVQAGAMEAQGAWDPPTVATPTSGSSVWVALGPLARLAAQAGPLFGEVELSSDLRVNREKFFVTKNGERQYLYTMPLVGAGAAAGLGLHF